MFRSERVLGRIASLSHKQSSGPMIWVFWGLLMALGFELGSFAGLFHVLHVETPWLLTYATVAGFLVWKFAFHTVLPSPALSRITHLVDRMSFSGEGVCHQICQDVYREANLIGILLCLLNVLSLFWVSTFPMNPRLSGLLYAAFFIGNGALCSWRPLTFFMLFMKNLSHVCGGEDMQKLASVLLDVPYDEPEDPESEDEESETKEPVQSE
jgi:hypothetical protein